MIIGTVNAAREAIISLSIQGPDGNHREIQALIDTGFDGSLTLPPNLIAALELPWRRRGRGLLADGSESVFDIYEATIFWHDQPRRVSVDEADVPPLVGMSLLYGNELVMQVVEGGSILIRVLQE